MRDTPQLDQINLDYSHKNITLSKQRDYMIKLFDMTNKFINRIRWKAFWFEQKKETATGNTGNIVNDSMMTGNTINAATGNAMNSEASIARNSDDLGGAFDNNTFSKCKFPSRRFAPFNSNLSRFEDELWGLVKSVKFRKYHNDFLSKMNSDMKRLKESNKVVAFSDKTSNLYSIDKSNYNKMLVDNVTKSYKKCATNSNTLDKINSEARELVTANNITGKIPKYETGEAFITIKDHKEQFPNTIKCRLINPAKTHIGKISKNILDKINCIIRQRTGLTQWKNSFEVIKWFDKIDNKSRKCFVCFDIVEFYPSITQQQLLAALDFAKNYVDISKTDVDFILHACKTILFNGGSVWNKNNNQGLFDVPMGSYHGAEICDLVGLHILYRMRSEFPEACFGLYRDDGLGIIDNASAAECERLKKRAHALFKAMGFRITINAGLRTTNFLDVTLNLRTNNYHPFRKPNSQTQYINIKSNHPPHIKRAIPRMVNKRLNMLSKDEKSFNDNKQHYVEALVKSGYKSDALRFDETLKINEGKGKRNRRKKAIYFNAPFCLSVKTNLGKEFFKIVDRNFGPQHPYHQILGKNNIKLSYSCMRNIKGTIQGINNRLLRRDEDNTATSRTCNCRNRSECPLEGKCLAENVVYKATVQTSREVKEYIGSTGDTFKKRFYGHSRTFRNRESAHTTLSKYVWEARDKGETPTISWKILHKIGAPRNPAKGICLICNLERLEIARADRRKSLNKRSELTGKCIHFRSAYLL